MKKSVTFSVEESIIEAVRASPQLSAIKNELVESVLKKEIFVRYTGDQMARLKAVRNELYKERGRLDALISEIEAKISARHVEQVQTAAAFMENIAHDIIIEASKPEPVFYKNYLENRLKPLLAMTCYNFDEIYNRFREWQPFAHEQYLKIRETSPDASPWRANFENMKEE